MLYVKKTCLLVWLLVKSFGTSASVLPLMQLATSLGAIDASRWDVAQASEKQRIATLSFTNFFDGQDFDRTLWEKVFPFAVYTPDVRREFFDVSDLTLKKKRVTTLEMLWTQFLSGLLEALLLKLEISGVSTAALYRLRELSATALSAEAWKRLYGLGPQFYGATQKSFFDERLEDIQAFVKAYLPLAVLLEASAGASAKSLAADPKEIDGYVAQVKKALNFMATTGRLSREIVENHAAFLDGFAASLK